MSKFINKLRVLIPTKRKIIQLYTALLFNANLKGFSTGNIYQGNTKKFCAPGINCYSCPGATGACPLGSLQGSFSADKSTIYYVAGILLLYSILFGRMICGWFCPFGLIQELVHKIPPPKLKKSPVTRVLSYFKYVVLVFFVFIVPITYAFRDTPLPAFCKYICPAGTLEGGIGLLANKVNASYFSMLGPLFTWKFLLLVSIIVGSVFVFRLFCRFICPLGALYGLFNRISVFGVKVEEPKCTHCNMCVNHCKLDVNKVGDQECISCGECIKVCPTKAIVWKGPKLSLNTKDDPSTPKKTKIAKNVTRTISAILLIAILAGSIVYYWNQPDQTNNPPGVADTDRGNQVGDLCYNTDLEIVNANGATGQTMDPTNTGKITIINFWGTWCTPCVGELPYFEQIADDYKDEVTVIAIHSAVSKETAPEYIGKYYNDASMLFSWDTGEGFNGDYYAALGGRGTYPYTVVFDENGIIAKIFFESLEYADLEEIVESLLG